MKPIKVKHDAIPIGAHVGLSHSGFVYEVVENRGAGEYVLRACSVQTRTLSTIYKRMELIDATPAYKMGSLVGSIDCNERRSIVEVYKDEPRYALIGGGAFIRRARTDEIYLPCK